MVNTRLQPGLQKCAPDQCYTGRIDQPGRGRSKPIARSIRLPDKNKNTATALTFKRKVLLIESSHCESKIKAVETLSQQSSLRKEFKRRQEKDSQFC